MIEKLKKWMFPKGIADLLLALGFLFAIGSLIGYLVSGVNIYVKEYYVQVIVGLILVLVVEALSLVVSTRLGKYLAYLLCLYSLVEYISSQIIYISNVLVSIDGSTFSAGFILTTICFVFSLGLSLASGIMTKEEDLAKFRRIKNGNKEEQNEKA